MSLHTLQQAVCEHLQTRPFFADSADPVEVIAAERGNLDAAIATALGKLSKCVVVEILNGPVGYSGAKAQVDATIMFTVFEHPVTNRAGRDAVKTALRIVDEVLVALHPSTTPPCHPQRWELIADLDDLLTYQVTATRKLFFSEAAT